MSEFEYDKRLFDDARVPISEWIGSLAERAGCESPIETALFKALVLRWCVFHGSMPKIVNEKSETIFGSGTIKISTQVKILSYRVDFLIEAENLKKKIVVECDGHNFHERTKEQAARDRRRDRDLAGMGYLVLRYTGSEIWKSAYECASDIDGHLSDALWEECDHGGELP